MMMSMIAGTSAVVEGRRTGILEVEADGVFEEF
jgi:hypothetical protein